MLCGATLAGVIIEVAGYSTTIQANSVLMILAMSMFTYRHFITGRQSITRHHTVTKPEKGGPKPENKKEASAHNNNVTGNNVKDKKSI